MSTSTTELPRTLRAGEVSVGDQLPPLELPITRTLIVATAIASRDYQDVHHDPELAEQRGSRDVFMNILTTNGLVGRFVTDWAGPASVLRALRIRLGVPNYPGDVMTLTGEVTEVGDDGDVVVRIRGANGLGDHVTGTATVGLPEDDR
jgi:acyl dehydratase